MNALARALTWLLAIALVMLPVVALVQGWIGASQWPLRTLRLQGDLQRVSEQSVRASVLPYAKRGYFAVDLDATQHAVEKLPWVQSAQVHKRWPDILEVRLAEHVPFARWGEDRLLSARGDLFPLQGEASDELPRLHGADERVGEVVALYNQAQELFAPAGLDIRELTLDARGSWSMRLSNGVRVVVGSSEAGLRLRRFARLLPQMLQNDPRPLQRADLRYTNGFALVWGKAGIGNGESGIGSPTGSAAPTPSAPDSASLYDTARVTSIPDSPFPIPELS